jgi:hypothetical protein
MGQAFSHGPCTQTTAAPNGAAFLRAISPATNTASAAGYERATVIVETPAVASMS